MRAALADPSARLYDMILCDSVMPVMDGPTAVQIIRGLGYDGPILGVTGNTLPEQIEDFMQHGADEVVGKPVKLPVLKSTMAEWSRKESEALAGRRGIQGSGGDTGGLHILVVEDAPVARTMLVKVLKTMKCTADEAEDGQQAVDKVRLCLYNELLSNPIPI